MTSFEFPQWYESTHGPEISKTIFNILGNIAPVANMVLASKGVHILPESFEVWINLAVFLYFSGQAAFGYIRSKKILGARIAQLEEQVVNLGGTPVRI